MPSGALGLWALEPVRPIISHEELGFPVPGDGPLDLGDGAEALTAFPAQAGMDPSSFRHRRPHDRLPRTRGDEPRWPIARSLGDCQALCTVPVRPRVGRFRLVGGCFSRGCLCSVVRSASRFGECLSASPIPGSLGDCRALCTVPDRAAVRGLVIASLASQILGPAASAAPVVCPSSLEG